MTLLLLLLFRLLPHLSCRILRAKCPFLTDQKCPLNYYRTGDVAIGGITSTADSVLKPVNFSEPPLINFFAFHQMKYSDLLPFLFATEKINELSSLLPNMTLGYNVYENYFNARMSSDAEIDLLSGGQKTVPNYSCGGQSNVLVVLEGGNSEISHQISTMLSIYKMPQISYSLDNQVFKEETQLPFLYRLAPNQDSYFVGIVKMLLHFRWTWIGLLASDNVQGERFLRALTPVLIRNGICIAFSERIPELKYDGKSFNFHSYSLFMQRKCNVFVYHGDTTTVIALGRLINHAEKREKSIVGKVWITAFFHDRTLRWFFQEFELQHIHGSFSFLTQAKMKTSTYNVYSSLASSINIGERAFICNDSNHGLSVKGSTRCRQKEELETPPHDKLESILSQHSYSIYNSILVVARAFNAFLYRSAQKFGRGRVGFQKLQPWQVFVFSKNPRIFEYLYLIRSIVYQVPYWQQWPVTCHQEARNKDGVLPLRIREILLLNLECPSVVKDDSQPKSCPP